MAIINVARAHANNNICMHVIFISVVLLNIVTFIYQPLFTSVLVRNKNMLSKTEREYISHKDVSMISDPHKRQMAHKIRKKTRLAIYELNYLLNVMDKWDSKKTIFSDSHLQGFIARLFLDYGIPYKAHKQLYQAIIKDCEERRERPNL